MSRTIWNEQTCFMAARTCNSRSDFNKRYRGAYAVAKANNWLDTYIWFTDPKEKWTRTACYNAAKECTQLSEFAHKYNRAYQIARTNGWLQTYTWFRPYSRKKLE